MKSLSQKFKEEYEEEPKEKKTKKSKIKINLINILKSKPKKFILNTNKATVIIPKVKPKPILRRSEIFENEYEKEKNILGWK
jgi:hypothetical protein